MYLLDRHHCFLSTPGAFWENLAHLEGNNRGKGFQSKQSSAPIAVIGLNFDCLIYENL